jgi:hypothetical protein
MAQAEKELAMSTMTPLHPLGTKLTVGAEYAVDLAAVSSRFTYDAERQLAVSEDEEMDKTGSVTFKTKNPPDDYDTK